MLVYKPNPKHKTGALGGGPPRWYPDADSLCPDDIDTSEAQTLLDDSIEVPDVTVPHGKARFAIDGVGRLFKGYSEGQAGTNELWHGFWIDEDRVKRQVPAKVLRAFVKAGKLARPMYKRLLGSA